MPISGVSECVAAIQATGTVVDVACREWVVESEIVVERAMKAYSIVDTGQLRRSVTSDPVEGGYGAPWVGRIYPSVIYSRRLELGFTGTDSLGRFYNQAARPRFGPAVDSVRMELGSLLATYVAEAIGG